METANIELETVSEDIFPYRPDRLEKMPLQVVKAESISLPARYCEYTNIAFLYKRPPADFYENHYKNEFWRRFSGSKKNAWEHIQAKTDNRLKLVQQTLREYHIELGAGQDYLDFGCGVGYFTKALAQNHQLRAFGLEPSQLEQKKARDSGIDIVASNLDELCSTGKNFDVISMIHVFEHILEPKEYLLRLKECLKDGGRLIIQVPDFDSISSLSLCHVFCYNIRSLAILLEYTGFGVEAFMNADINPDHRKNLTVVAKRKSDFTEGKPLPISPAKTYEQVKKRHKFWLEYAYKQSGLRTRVKNKIRQILRVV